MKNALKMCIKKEEILFYIQMIIATLKTVGDVKNKK